MFSCNVKLYIFHEIGNVITTFYSHPHSLQYQAQLTCHIYHKTEYFHLFTGLSKYLLLLLLG
jgi:hypothetical protein